MKLAFLLLLCSITVAVSAQDSTQAQFIGTYKFVDGSVIPEVVVGFENGGLTMNSSAGVSVIQVIKGDSFNIVSFNGTATFKRNEAKKVIGVHIEASGYTLDGVKDGSATHTTGMKETPALFIEKWTALTGILRDHSPKKYFYGQAAAN